MLALQRKTERNDIVWYKNIAVYLIKVIIPAYNEAASIAKVIKAIPDFVTEVIVVDNRSTDGTGKVAELADATVISQPKAGYGNACLKGLEYLSLQKTPPEIVVFIDGDYSDYAEDMADIVRPIIKDDIDFVVGARVANLREKNAMTPQQLWGNKLATSLMRIIYGSEFTDLGPFRAIKYEKLLALEMSDTTYGWTVEMQLKALKKKLTYKEVPVRYRNRIGHSKISGTLKGTIMAGIKIIGWIFKYSLQKNG